DAASHRPLMLTYRGVSPRIIVQTQRGGPPPADSHTAPTPQAPAGDIVDITMFFDDYRAVGGVQLPHHITPSVAGTPSEELTFKPVTINPASKPDSFSGQ